MILQLQIITNWNLHQLINSKSTFLKPINTKTLKTMFGTTPVLISIWPNAILILLLVLNSATIFQTRKKGSIVWNICKNIYNLLTKNSRYSSCLSVYNYMLCGAMYPIFIYRIIFKLNICCIYSAKCRIWKLKRLNELFHSIIKYGITTWVRSITDFCCYKNATTVYWKYCIKTA